MITAMSTMTVVREYDGCKKIERLLTIWDEVAHAEKGRFFRTTVDEKTQMGTIVVPRGFPIGILKRELRGHGYREIGPTYEPRAMEIASTSEPKNRQQEEALAFLDDVDGRGRRTLNLRTDEGKTYIALRHICDLGRLGLVVVHNSQVLKQWMERITQLTDIRTEEIGVLKGHKSLDKYEPGGPHKIFVAMHRTLDSVIERDPPRLDRFCREHGIGVKVYDEAHLELRSIFTIDSYTDVPLTVYLTATANRTDWKEGRAFKYVIPIGDGEKFGGGAEKVAKTHRYHMFRFVHYRTGTPFSEQAALHGRRGFDLNRWAKNSIRDERAEFLTSAVMDMIARVDSEWRARVAAGEAEVDDPPRHCILLKTLDQCKHFGTVLEVLGKEFGHFSGLTKDQKERFEQLGKRYIVATEKSIGTAIDCEVDVMHCTVPMSSSSWFHQVVGRLRQRRMGLFVDYVDVSIEACEVIGRIQLKMAKRIAKSVEIEDRCADGAGTPPGSPAPTPAPDAPEPAKKRKPKVTRTAKTEVLLREGRKTNETSNDDGRKKD